MSRKAKVTKVVETPIGTDQKTKSRANKWLVPALLLLLKTQPTHGYDLIDKLMDLDIDYEKYDPGTVYRSLREMETEGLVKSKWATDASGPARRVYEVTDKGTEKVCSWTIEVERQLGLFTSFLKQLRKVTQG